MSSTDEPRTHSGLPISDTGRNPTLPSRPPGHRCTCPCGCTTRLSIYNTDDELNVCAACHPNRIPPCTHNRRSTP